MTAFIAKGKEGPRGSTGDVGPSGLSAYQVALNNGFVGTEAAWLASLQGPPGEGSAYTHPATHPASMIDQDSTHRFATDTEKADWNSRASGSHSHTLVIGNGADPMINMSLTERLNIAAGSNVSLSYNDATNTITINTSGELTGNAETATRLVTARTINGVPFDGSANITVQDRIAIIASDNSIGTLPLTTHGYEVRSNGVGTAVMSFHRAGSWACYLGLDLDNKLKIGGYSYGNAAYTLLHEGMIGPTLDFTGGTLNAKPFNYIPCLDGDRDAATKYPNANPQLVRFDFVNALSVGTGGSYAGVMTFSPFVGTTASTGDASYQLAFGSTAANIAGIPQLKIRNGIDTTWNTWHNLLHSGNYRDYPTASASSSRIANPVGAEFVYTGGTIAGALRVVLPVGFLNTMMRMTIKVFEYAINQSFEVVIAGYVYSEGNQWINVSAYILGNPSVNRQFTIRFGRTASGNPCVYIGELGTIWQYPQFFVTDVQLGYSGISDAWLTGWVCSVEQTAFENVTGTISGSQIGLSSAAPSGPIISSAYTINSGKLLGRGSAGAGALEEITLGTNLSLSGTTLNAAGGSGGLGAFTWVSTQTVVNTTEVTVVIPGGASEVIVVTDRIATSPASTGSDTPFLYLAIGSGGIDTGAYPPDNYYYALSLLSGAEWYLGNEVAGYNVADASVLLYRITSTNRWVGTMSCNDRSGTVSKLLPGPLTHLKFFLKSLVSLQFKFANHSTMGTPGYLRVGYR